MATKRPPKVQFILALGLSSLVSVGFFAYGALRNQSTEYSYLVWNLFLAWIPVIFAFWLTRILRRKLWSSWEALCVSVLWLVFLPNSFYMISDFIHLRDSARVDVLYDSVMLTSFIYTGVLLGFTSLYLIHTQLKKRLSSLLSALAISATLLACSFAIYIGRDLRWNSWDVLANPGGLLFDVADRLQHPASYPQMSITVISFFVLLSSMYIVAWRIIKLFRHGSSAD